MPLRDAIKQAQEQALKARDTGKVSTLRLLWSNVRTEEINQRKELDDGGVVAVVARMIKQLKDSIVDFTTGGRDDLKTKAEAEVRLLEEYLPKQLSDEELEGIVKKIALEIGLSGQSQAGQVMGTVMKIVKGQAEGNRVREMVNKILTL
ncbi:MAG: GatB/YqeY domain-containing protein [Patescibacteria group bacterium]